MTLECFLLRDQLSTGSGKSVSEVSTLTQHSLHTPNPQTVIDPNQRSIVAASAVFPKSADISSLKYMSPNDLLKITPLKPVGQVFKDRANIWKTW